MRAKGPTFKALQKALPFWQWGRDGWVIVGRGTTKSGWVDLVVHVDMKSHAWKLWKVEVEEGGLDWYPAAGGAWEPARLGWLTGRLTERVKTWGGWL